MTFRTKKTVGGLTVKKIAIYLISFVLIVGIIPMFAACGNGNVEDPEDVTYIDGYVRDEATGSPLEGVTVYLDDDSFVTQTDGRFFFTQLDKGREYRLSCTTEHYEPFYQDVLAVYPSSNVEINLKLLGITNPKPSPIKQIRIDHLESFDFNIEHGVSENMITVKEEGSFLAPDKFQFKLSTNYSRESPTSDGSTEGSARPPQYCIQLGDKQWIDYGDGYFLNNERKHQGFEDVFNSIDYAVGRANLALEASNYVRDFGEFMVGGRKTRRLKTLTVVPNKVKVGEEEIEQQLLIELTASICIEEGDLLNVPVDLSVSAFESVRKIKTFTHFRLSNINIIFKIDAPEEGQSAVEINTEL